MKNWNDRTCSSVYSTWIFVLPALLHCSLLLLYLLSLSCAIPESVSCSQQVPVSGENWRASWCSDPLPCAHELKSWVSAPRLSFSFSSIYRIYRRAKWYTSVLAEWGWDFVLELINTHTHFFLFFFREHHKILFLFLVNIHLYLSCKFTVFFLSCWNSGAFWLWSLPLGSGT